MWPEQLRSQCEEISQREGQESAFKKAVDDLIGEARELRTKHAKLVAALKAIRECQDLAQARLQARVALEELGE